MTNRERFRRLMQYEPVDRLPVMAVEPFEPEALARWRLEGLPADVAVEDHLGMARLVRVPVEFGPIPGFEARVLAEDETYVVETTYLGATIRKRRDHPAMFYGHVDHPVKSRADWEAYRERFRPDEARLPANWASKVVPALTRSEEPVALVPFPFFFRLGFYAMGMERFLSGFYEEPRLMHDIFDHWSAFVVETLRPVVRALAVDVAIIADDLAGKNGPLISPRIYREFWHPYQDRVLELFREHGIPLICQWSSGRFQELMPEMGDHGFNCTWPLEVMAGMDAHIGRAHV
jgi:uroporphyrinogen decarboxylase